MENATLIQLFEDTLDGIEPGSLQADTAFRGLKVWDSLAVLLVTDSIDQACGVVLPRSVFAECRTIDDLSAAIRRQQGGG